MAVIPQPIPVTPVLPASSVVAADASAYQTFDVGINGLGFRLATDEQNPYIRETAPFVAQRIDQSTEPGEQTLTTWWPKAQSSFHGGAGQLNLERVDQQDQLSHLRFDASKGVDALSIPGQITRLPDTTVVSSDTTSSMAALPLSGGTVDGAIYVNQAGALKRFTAPATLETFTIGESVISCCTDGVNAYAASSTGVWKVPATGSIAATAVKIYTWPSSETAPVLAWVKSRLMAGACGSVWELDPNPGTPPVALAIGGAQERLHSPVTGWKWRAFASTPKEIVAAGDAFGVSEFVAFTLTSAGATPILTASDTIGDLPVGERCVSLLGVQGTFLVIGTTKGVRVATFETYTGAMKLGPLLLAATDPQWPCSGVAARDRFVFAAGLAYDEPGLTRFDLGMPVDQAGRVAYCSDLVAPALPANTNPATVVITLPVTGKLMFSVPASGVLMEGSVGSARSAWLRTSRIRFNTTEPKIFKLGRVRGSFASSSVDLTGTTSTSTTSLGSVGFTTLDPEEFRLPPGPQEWLQLTFTLNGSAKLTSYGLKALPGTRRQRLFQLPLQLSDSERDRNDALHSVPGSAWARLQALEELDTGGDEVLFEEFLPSSAPRRARCVIEKVSFRGAARPTPTSSGSGMVVVTLRTVEL